MDFETIDTKYGKVFLIEKLDPKVKNLPFSIKILLENLMRNFDNNIVTKDDIKSLINMEIGKEIPFFPTRVILQDYTGIPLIVDLASMRSHAKRLNLDPLKINPKVPVDLVIDHSIQVDYFGTSYALKLNMEKEYERNYERYMFLKWAQKAFKNFRVIPPGKGIIHQVNLEYLAKVIDSREGKVFPDTLIGTDSHTTMINGIGVLGWGVGGIEAEAVMLGLPYYIPIPETIGIKLIGEPREGITATDIVLTITEMLRKENVVGKFVEFFGPSLTYLTAQDRATISNMAPEYGSTISYFPIDNETLDYLRYTGRSKEHIEMVEFYSKIQGLFYEGQKIEYSKIIEFDLSQVEPCIAGPRNPEERIPLSKVKEYFKNIIEEYEKRKKSSFIPNGAVVLSSITSCTNTSNPSVILEAAILAKKAVERGLKTKEYIKTSFAPGSLVVTEYLKLTNLLPYLEALGFHIVGYGCTTCIGNSGPLPSIVAKEIVEKDVYVVGVISGNRNFEGRINPLLKATFLASPPLVVAYSLAGKIDIDFYNEPIGYDPNGSPVYLKEIWPSFKEIKEYLPNAYNIELYSKIYKNIEEGDENWNKIKVEESEAYNWPSSTYIKEPPWFDEIHILDDIIGARVLLLLGDRITTDHISPAGPITKDSEAGKYLLSLGEKDLNTFGARRGNHEVMLRGGFSNIKLKNYLVDKEGGYTLYFPTNEILTVYEAAMRYKKNNVPLIIIAGKQYGAGSSRDWAAKVTALLGVRAVIAQSFERIHRSNLVAMGVIPLQIDKSWKELGIRGNEIFNIEGLKNLKPKGKVRVKAIGENSIIEFEAIARVDTSIELEYLKKGGIIPYIFEKVYGKG
jgi:aconitate hydratase